MNTCRILLITVVCAVLGGCAIEVAEEDKLIRPVEVGFRLDGETVAGDLIVWKVIQDGGRAMSNAGRSGELKKVSKAKWTCKLDDGKRYKAGWSGKMGLFGEMTRFNYFSEEFIARQGMEFVFAPGEAAILEYNFGEVPSEIKAYPSTISLAIEQQHSEEKSFLWVVTGEEIKSGSGKIEGLVAGKYLMRVSNVQDQDWYTQPVVHDERIIDIKAGQVNRFEAVYPMIKRTAKAGDAVIRGRVVKCNGTAVGGHKIALVPYFEGSPKPGKLYYPSIVTDDTGSFEFIGVESGLGHELISQGGRRFVFGHSLGEGALVDTEIVVGIEKIEVSEGKAIEDITIEWKDGKHGKLSDLRGKTVVIDVWASWCGPCKAAMPELNKLAGTIKGNRNVVFLAIGSDKTKGDWEEMVESKEWANLRHGWFNRKTNCGYLANRIPYTIIVDAEGGVVKEGNGVDVEDTLARLSGKTLSIR